MNSPFSAVLLAGGKSSRMGRDKVLIEIEGEPLWQRQLRLLRSLQPAALFVAGPRRLKWPQSLIIDDARPVAGPLGGLVAALRRSNSALLLALAVDLPHMTSDYLRGLVRSACLRLADRDTQAGRMRYGVVPCRAGRYEPLAAIYPKDVLPLAERCLESGRYSMHEFVQDCSDSGFVRLVDIAAADEPLFLNMNSPEDLVAFTNA